MQQYKWSQIEKPSLLGEMNSAASSVITCAFRDWPWPECDSDSDQSANMVRVWAHQTRTNRDQNVDKRHLSSSSREPAVISPAISCLNCCVARLCSPKTFLIWKHKVLAPQVCYRRLDINEWSEKCAHVGWYIYTYWTTSHLRAAYGITGNYSFLALTSGLPWMEQKTEIQWNLHSFACNPWARNLGYAWCTLLWTLSPHFFLCK